MDVNCFRLQSYSKINYFMDKFMYLSYKETEGIPSESSEFCQTDIEMSDWFNIEGISTNSNLVKNEPGGWMRHRINKDIWIEIFSSIALDFR